MKRELSTKISNLKKILIAAVCILSLSSCGEKTSEPEENIPSESIVSGDSSESEISEESAEEPAEESKPETVFNYADVDEVPENARVKKTRYIVTDGERQFQSTEYLDEYGNPMRMLYNSGGAGTKMTQYINEYDEKGNLVSVKTIPYEGFESLVAYEYNDDDTVKTVTRSENGVVNTIETYSYNEHGDTASIETSLPDGGDVYGTTLFEYEYDENGRAVTEIQKDTTDFVYASIYRTYDDRGNVLTEKSTYGENTDGTTKVYGYDGQNRLISAHDVSPDGEEMFFMEYDYEQIS